MTVAVTLGAVAIALVALWWFARDATTVCVIDITSGRATITRGGIAPRIFADIGDVVRRPAIASATVRIVRRSGHAELEIRGDVSDAQRQQLRNVVGSVPLAKLINARRR